MIDDRKNSSEMTPEAMEARRAYWQSYREKNRERIRENQARYRDAHRDELRERARRWRQDHPNNRRAINARYWNKKAHQDDNAEVTA